ncbi:hypothetical protein TSOC_002329 [Tetrabaena socialis]|uniref:Uncharacterized protein n=1 Tax=Tetrabaena socialis TaxID=47790 RepID=A0A2J8AE96_9CHLO|nr:hypothetical protein TSOC_002329 [Tetrabaena socialis]|eukprot:PNH10850.1 hypothetical protein TSOC_002329 [Tetrabaena socialis]
MRAILELHTAALSLTRRFSKAPSVTGLSLLASHSRSALLKGHHRRLLRGPLLGGALGGAAMLPSGGSVIAQGLHGLTPGQLFDVREMGLLGWLLVDLAINWVGWAAAAALKTEVFYDLLGSVSFLVLTAGSLATGGAFGVRKFVVSGMVGLWTLRLGSYLVTRIAKTGKDARFDEVKEKPGVFFVYWTMQAVWVFVSLLPVLLANGARAPVAMTALDAIGIAVFALGLGLEAVADQQKAAFKARPENKGRFIDEGLWSLSRHPNYCGEMMLWWGVFLTCVPAFTSGWHYVSVLSPVTVFLLLRYVSGVPLLEKMAEQRWGAEPEFQAYRARTNLLLPLPRFKDSHTS